MGGRARWVGDPGDGYLGWGAWPCGAGTEMAKQKRNREKEPRAIRELRARQRRRVAAIRKLNARYADGAFPKGIPLVIMIGGAP